VAYFFGPPCKCRGKNILQCPMVVVGDANEFGDADFFWKNCGSVIAVFLTPCRNSLAFTTNTQYSSCWYALGLEEATLSVSSCR